MLIIFFFLQRAAPGQSSPICLLSSSGVPLLLAPGADHAASAAQLMPCGIQLILVQQLLAAAGLVACLCSTIRACPKHFNTTARAKGARALGYASQPSRSPAQGPGAGTGSAVGRCRRPATASLSYDTTQLQSPFKALKIDWEMQTTVTIARRGRFGPDDQSVCRASMAGSAALAPWAKHSTCI